MAKAHQGKPLQDRCLRRPGSARPSCAQRARQGGPRRGRRSASSAREGQEGLAQGAEKQKLKLNRPGASRREVDPSPTSVQGEEAAADTNEAVSRKTPANTQEWRHLRVFGPWRPQGHQNSSEKPGGQQDSSAAAPEPHPAQMVQGPQM